MKKKFMLVAAACLLSGAAFAQSGDPTCVQDPTDPNCVCVGGENDGDCNDGVHRGLVASTAIHDSVTLGLSQDRTAAALHFSR